MREIPKLAIPIKNVARELRQQGRVQIETRWLPPVEKAEPTRR